MLWTAQFISWRKRGAWKSFIYMWMWLLFSVTAILFSSSLENLSKKKYSLKWVWKPTLYLGHKIKIGTNMCSISRFQPQYVVWVLERFGMIRFDMVTCNLSRSPLPHKNLLLVGSGDDVNAANKISYQILVGFLQWIVSSTGPNLSYTGWQLSCLNSACKSQHCSATSRVLRPWVSFTRGMITVHGNVLTLISPMPFNEALDTWGNC